MSIHLHLELFSNYWFTLQIDQTSVIFLSPKVVSFVFLFHVQYVALYSYEPTKNSPNPNPSYELEFQEGDIVRILDVSRADGFYMGQVCVLLLSPSLFLFKISHTQKFFSTFTYVGWW